MLQSNVTIKINNVLGEEVYSNNFGKTSYGNIYDINTSNLTRGIYVMTVCFDNQVITRKVSIE